MPKITEVSPQKKNPKRFDVYLDGQFAFGADEDLIVNYRLVPGKIIPQETLEKLLFESEVGKVMEKMYRLFGVRQRSEKEVRDYFKRKNFAAKVKGKEEIGELVINLVRERLKQKGLTNDLEFAKSWIASRRKNKNKGKTALKNELYQKGIDKEIIEQALINISSEDELVLAKQALDKKLKAWKNLEAGKRHKKALEFLARKGFDYPTINQILKDSSGKF